MQAHIRPFEPRDYPAAVEVANRSYPEYRDTVEEWKHRDRHRNPELVLKRFVAEVEGRVVGVASFEHEEGMFHPHKFEVSVTVDPDWRRRGIGRQLYERLMAELAPQAPIGFHSSTREDQADARAFLERRGFREAMRNWENHLHMADFDPSRFAGAIEAVEAQGIVLRSFAELRASDPGFFPKLYTTVDELHHDVPHPGGTTSVDYAHWVERISHNPNLMPEGYFIACDGVAYAGLSTLYRSEVEDYLFTGLTGVRRPYRRRGIALALKLKALDFARAKGYQLIKTWNASTNTGMLAINEALGFRRQPAWIFYTCDLAQASEAGEADPKEREEAPVAV